MYTLLSYLAALTFLILSRSSSIEIATAAQIPSGLLPLVFEYMGADAAKDEEDWQRRWNDGLRDLKSCSLVCVDWANQCRPVLVPKLTIKVCSEGEMKKLDFFAKCGSKRLTPMADLIQLWILKRRPWTSQSWCRGRYRSSFQLKTSVEHVDGLPFSLVRPVPPAQSMSAPERDNPCPTPSSRDIPLGDIHFPSFDSLATLLRHFAFSPDLTPDNIRRNNADGHVGSPVFRTSTGELVTMVWGCTDNIRICSQCAQVMLGSDLAFATAADIPSELFPAILDYVGIVSGWGAYFDRDKRKGIIYLKSCSLVCVDWAN